MMSGMRFTRFAMTLIVAVFPLAYSASAAAVTEIQWWHSMTGELNDRSTRSPTSSTPRRTEYKVTPVYKGQYDESMTAAIAAYRAGNPPQIVQVFEVGTATMMAAKGAVKPVYQLMAEPSEPFDPKGFLGAVYGYYADTYGQPDLDAVQQLDAGALHQRRRVQEGRARSRAIRRRPGPKSSRRPRSSRPPAPRAASRPAGNRGCSSRASAPGTTCRSPRKENGFGGLDTRLEFNGPVQVRHIQNLADWAKKGAVHLQGPQGRAAGHVHQRRVRDDHHVDRARTPTSRPTPSSPGASRRCRTTPTSRARRRTRSSAAPRCGC